MVASVSPPVDHLADEDLMWHMSQHLVLLLIAGPLLVLAGMTTWRGEHPLPLSAVVAGAIANIAAVTAWHIPVLFDLADRVTAVHIVEHLSFVAASAALWWCAGLGRRPAPLAATVVVFVASLPGIALGAAMTLSATPWYDLYPSVTQQQVSGSLMWSIGGLGTIACGVLSFSRAVTA